MASEGVFRLLVTVALLIVLLAVIFTYIVPLFFIPSDFSKEVRNGLETAQAYEGKAMKGTRVSLSAPQSINGKNFETFGTLVVFKCSDASLCCEDFKGCTSSLSIDTVSKTLSVKKAVTIQPYFRCMYEHKLYVCNVFLGLQPAQVEISAVNAQKSIDLSKGSRAIINFDYKNSGDNDASEPLTAKVQVFNKLDNNPLKEPLFENQKQVSKAKAKEVKSENIEVLFYSAGDFEIKVSVESEESGKDEKTVEIKASGIPRTDCTATIAESPEWYSGTIEELQGKCVSKANCEKCSTSFECRNSWLSREATVAAASNEYAYTVEISSLCPSS